MLTRQVLLMRGSDQAILWQLEHRARARPVGFHFDKAGACGRARDRTVVAALPPPSSPGQQASLCSLGAPYLLMHSTAYSGASHPFTLKQPRSPHVHPLRVPFSVSVHRQDASDIGNHSHPYLRTQLLSNDYAIYDAERARLFRRAAKQGIAVVAASQSAPLRV
eukprot:1074304-Pleurochrysis_carterae.AAC.3